MPRQLDIANKRLHDIIGVGKQLQLVAFDARNPLTSFAQLKQGRCDATVFLRENVFAGFEVIQPFGGRRPHGAGTLGATFA
ncbi:Uncharacterised protein [Salmonella enterica subsp. enterica serovar Bovismorbificans]|uniref:Uncharacterized protein n=1 Tax=Salmonella enterica subsp. enterica serovar Bovismorbificans TaxID=58097 RepID=A0A655E3X2_SALET|nr:Uncharacterised protein [Salmonella enterica subsp. enterica serovar Bovismorbificans]CNV02943.1 Uncharacterised protein [Salmonella enterica subsp. enterica serovar Bovismorbificans]